MSRFAVLATVLLLPSLAEAAWETREIAGMSVEIYTPASTSPIGTGRALMIPLHGCTQTAVQLRDYGNFEHTADDFGMVVAIPLVPNGGVIAGCWDYYAALHTRTSGHNGNLIEMVETVRDDAGFGVDAAQIYLAGFSAGGGQAIVLGCLAPELFAGVGTAAGPSLGTTVAEIAQVSTTADGAATLCNQFAGSQAAALATQLAVAFTDTADFTVAQGYAAINAEMFAGIYGAATPSPFDMASLPGTTPAGMGTAYDDADGPRVTAMVSTSGVGHAWPSGSGTAGVGLSYVSGSGLDFAAYLATFFTANSRRASGEWDPGDEGGGESSASDGGADDAAGSDAGTGDLGTTADDPGSDGGDDEGDDEGAASVATFGQDDGRIQPSGCQCSATGGLAWSGWLGFAVVVRLRRRRVA